MAVTPPKDREFQLLMKKDVLEWTVSDVAKWLTYMDLGDYQKTFIENSVSGLELVDLNHEDMESLGLKSFGHRKKLESSLRKLLDDSSSQCSSSFSRNSSSSISSLKAAPTNITCKVYYHSKVFAVTVKREITLSELKTKIKSKFKKSMKLQYKDDDDDLIGLSSEKDWRAALKLCGDRIRIYCKSCSSKSSSSKSSSKKRYVETQKRELLVLEMLTEPIVMINEHGEITFFNSSAEKAFGYRRVAVIGENVKILMPEEHAVNHDRYIENYLRTGVAKVVGLGRQVPAVRKNGERFPMYLTISETKSRRTRSFIGTMQDLSNRADADVTKVRSE